MNLRKEHGPLRPQQCKALNHAWTQALREGFPLNVMLSIRPENRPPLEHAKLVDQSWNRLGVWSRRHTPNKTFHAILVRETKGGEHFHVLMHVSGKANLTRLRYALAQWFPNGEANVTRAHHGIGFTPSGKIKSALGYVTKERTPQAAWPKWQYRPGRPVLGKRYRISGNLRAKPIDLSDNNETLRSPQGCDSKVIAMPTAPFGRVIQFAGRRLRARPFQRGISSKTK